MIPKVFHLTSKSKNLPERFQSNVDRIKEIYPEFEIRIHDDDDIISFMKANYPAYYEDTICKMPNFIMVLDTVRYMWMQTFGGIYCDMDVFFNKRFEFYDGVVFVEREWTYPTDPSIKNSVHNCWFASEPNHPIWGDILHGIANNVHELRGRTARPLLRNRLLRFVERRLIRLQLLKPAFPLVFNVTGPNAISKIITQRSLLSKYGDVQIAPRATVYQHGMSKGERQNAFFVHETAASWTD